MISKKWQSNDIRRRFDIYVRYVLSTLLIDDWLTLTGEQHRKQRKMLNPVFSLANMRDLLPIIQPIATKLTGIFQSQLPPNGKRKKESFLRSWPLY